MNKSYQIAIYMRISRDDLTQNESDSITNQRSLIYQYIKSCPDLSLENVTEYYDDGMTGSNFDRPQFNQMLKQLQNKSCNCVIVKDFSRLGRNYIEVSDYIEQIFPFLGIRFISINDDFDSLKDESSMRMDVSFKNLIHDYYIKDLSQKMRTAFHTKMKNGTFIPSAPIFGYKIIKDKGRKLVVDEYSAGIVKRIFEMVTEGITPLEVSQLLNAESIPTPSAYRQQESKKRSAKDNFWRRNIICYIVSDERYTGKGIFKKSERLEISINKFKVLPKDQWIVVPENHPAIISEEQYQKALYRMKHPLSDIADANKRKVLVSKVKCHCCGYTMKRTNHKKTKYYCQTPKFIPSPSCVVTPIEESEIVTILTKAIQVKISVFLESEKNKDAINKRKKADKMDELERKKKLQSSINNINKLKFKAYEQYTDGKITKDEFQLQKAQYDQQVESLQVQVNEFELINDTKLLSTENEHDPFYQLIKQNGAFTTLTREIVDTLVDKIIVYDEKRIEIVWKFTDGISK